jgi:hypothetical protein
MRRAAQRCSLAGGILAALACPAASAAAGSGASQPGAYCPLPEKGEAPRCLEPAQSQYGSFFAAVEDGSAHDGRLAEVEGEVARGAAGEHAYLALSSLAYGYYRLAQQASASATESPDVVERLERWNRLLARAYDVSPDDAHYRDAVRLAATDINDRVELGLPCEDAQGNASECNSTESVLRGFNAASERVGIRGALERIVLRIFGGDS